MDWHLSQWKNETRRKPLLIRGARQVGKTYAVRTLGKQFTSFVEVNFEQEKRAAALFDKDLHPKRILEDLSYLLQQDIIPGKTLLFFDEIQACPNAITALRYFYEQMPELHVIAAGSLLDFALEEVGIPVGRVESLYARPVSFIEFLVACGESFLAKALVNATNTLPLAQPIHEKLLSLVGRYIAIGGMPEAIFAWLSSSSPKQVQKVHHALLDTYRQDFFKYAQKHQLPYISALFEQLPSLVCDQFKYTRIHGEFKKRELAPCLDLLCLAHVINKVHHTAGNGMPLGAESNSKWFKLIFLDVGLCQAALGLDGSIWFTDPQSAFTNQGAITESFIGQELLSYAPPYRKTDLHFWKADMPSPAEIDYIVTYQNTILPIEVKSGDGRTLKSLHRFLVTHPLSPKGLRFCNQQPSLHNSIETLPLYAACTLRHEDHKEALADLVR